MINNDQSTLLLCCCEDVKSHRSGGDTVPLSLFYTLCSLSFSRLECRLNGLKQGSKLREIQMKAHWPNAAGTSKNRRRNKCCPAIKCAVYHDPAPRSRPGEITGVNSSGGSHPPAYSDITSSRIAIRTSHAISSYCSLHQGLPIDSQISIKIKEKIWNEEFVDFGVLLSNPGQDKFRYRILKPAPQLHSA